ncbi:hypothetical protein AC1031_003757 [Aphanomyces cochlioides]|nr:hypothetical protein AC1031_003757 [Aphanomyces cochlioides]
MLVHPELIERLATVDKPTQKLLKNVIQYEPVQQMLMSFLADTSRSFEDWIWDPKTREVLARLERMAQSPGQDIVREDPTLQATYEDALVNGIDNMDAQSIYEAANVANEAGKTHFGQKRFEAALTAFRKAADLLKPQLDAHADTLAQLFVTCCTNAAICGIKVEQWPVVREYAQYALVHDPQHGKAWYCLAKLFLKEQRYDEAKDAVENSLEINPTDPLCKKVLQDIEVVRERSEARLAKENEKLREEAESARKKEAERLAKLQPKEDKLKPRFVPLPQPTSSANPSSLLNSYFMKSRETFAPEYAQLNDLEDGEPPLFQCTITNITTNTMLARSQAANKKKAQTIASEVAIMKLWSDRYATNNLHKEDQEYLDQHPEVLAKFQSMDFDAAHTEPLDMTTKLSTYKCAIFLRHQDKGMMPSMYLNELHAQGKLHFGYEVEDLSDIPNNIQLFRVSALLNGRIVATHEHPSKKTAKQVVAKEALEIAIRESREMFPDQTEHDEPAETK